VTRRAFVFVALGSLVLGSCKRGPQDRIAFVSMRSDPPGIHVAFADGSQPVRVSSSRAWVAAPPVWSPSGDRLAYTVETAPDKWAIEIYDVKTGASTQVTKGMKLEDWSPDGAWLLATSLVDTDSLLEGKKALKRSLQQVYAIPTDPAGNRLKLSDGVGWDYSPAISPDGARVAYMSNRNDKVELRVVNIAGGGHKRLVLVRGDDVLGSPTWSPDGGTLAFECKRGGASAIQRLCHVSSAGGEAPDLTSSWAASPDWSPDGKRIAFVAIGGDEGKEQIFVMNANGSGAKAITEEGNNSHPAWSADGSRIAFVSDVPGNPDVMIVAADGGSPANVTAHVSRDAFPAWQPRVAAPP